MAQLHGCVRYSRHPALHDAGLIHLMCFVYLAYGDRFVTRNDGQHNARTAIADLARLKTKVIT